MKASEILSELVVDIRRHAESARRLHENIPVGDGKNDRSARDADRARLAAKAVTYEHAAELVADAALRLPEERNGWADAHVAMQNLQIYLARHHDLGRTSFTFGGIGDVYVWVDQGISSAGKPIALDVREPLTNDRIDAAVKTWRESS